MFIIYVLLLDLRLNGLVFVSHVCELFVKLMFSRVCYEHITIHYIVLETYCRIKSSSDIILY